MHTDVNEEVFTFGRNDGLTGILARPEDDPGGLKRPGVLFWNAGLLHRVGPYRLFVDLSRQLARKGFPTFRFDITGYGDSSGFTLSLPDREQAVLDVREAMSFLSANYPVKKFVLIGLCSGADQAFKCALADDRVSGMISLDGYAYPTPLFYLYYGRYLTRVPLSKYAHFLRNIFGLYTSEKEKSKLDAANEATWWTLPPKADVISGLQELIARRVKMLFLYSAGVKDNYNYRHQFRDMFKELDFKGLMEYDYYDQADHLYYRIPIRNRLIHRICEWMTHQYRAG